jgi:GNAT superfamily N-acetyltransferase
MAFTVRPYGAGDAEFVIGTRMEWEPTVGEDYLTRLLSGHIAPISHFAVAEVGNVRAGYATLTRPTDTPNPVAVVVVRRAFQGQGVGRELAADLDAALAGESAESWVSDDIERDLAVAQHWGYEITSHGIESLLARDKVGPATDSPSGYTAMTMSDSDVDAKLERQLDALMLRGSTHPEAVDLGWTVTVSELRGYSSENLWSLVLYQGEPVAVCVAAPRTGASWVVAFTVVDPIHRGRDLARIVKQHLHVQAVALGASDFATRNEERNVAIRALNASMGYIKIGGEYRLKREVSVS